MPSKDGKRLKETILESAEKVEENEFGENDWELVCNVFQVLCFHFMAQLRMNICTSDILGHAHRSWSVQSLDRAVEQRSQGTREDGDPHSNCYRRYLDFQIYCSYTSG